MLRCFDTGSEKERMRLVDFHIVMAEVDTE
jgi:hypothetical protein